MEKEQKGQYSSSVIVKKYYVPMCLHTACDSKYFVRPDRVLKKSIQFGPLLFSWDLPGIIIIFFFTPYKLQTFLAILNTILHTSEYILWKYQQRREGWNICQLIGKPENCIFNWYFTICPIYTFVVDSTVLHYGSDGNRTRGSKFQVHYSGFLFFSHFMVGCNHDVTIIMTE